MRDEPRTRSKHLVEHVVPTVIHDPEEKMPALARWVRHTMANPTRFWGLIALVVLAVTGLAIVSSGLPLGRSTSDAAWVRLETARTPAERVEIAQEYPNTQARQWALLQAATEYYNQGFNDLPSNRDAALPALKKALDQFEEVAREAPEDSPQASAAALGVARTYEARNELDKAIKQYEKVASTWKGSPEAAEAERYAQALRRPENVAFYKELYAFKPVEATLPPMGQGALTLPPNHPPINGPAPGDSVAPLLNFPAPLDLPPPPPSPPASSSPAPAPAPAPASPADAPRTEAPQDKGKTTPEPTLPPDVFSPKKPTSPPTTPSPSPSPAPAPVPAPASTPADAPKTEAPQDKEKTAPEATLPPDVFAPEKPRP
jgi:hypothetical protein